jgi:hypothetical protein
MNTIQQDVCPTCNGDKMIPGVCECDSEWRGTEVNNDWADCHCTPDVTCLTCNGSGSAQLDS